MKNKFILLLTKNLQEKLAKEMIESNYFYVGCDFSQKILHQDQHSLVLRQVAINAVKLFLVLEKRCCI